jgi:tetrahydromethanopterin S-methyltransferase subunit E
VETGVTLFELRLCKRFPLSVCLVCYGINSGAVTSVTMVIPRVTVAVYIVGCASNLEQSVRGISNPSPALNVVVYLFL